MKELLEKITATFTAFSTDAVKEANKSAAVRARKASLELEKLLKQYRKDSVK